MQNGKIFRSDRLSKLSAEDQQTVDQLDIELIIDLRRSTERETDPTLWRGPEQWHAPIFADQGRSSFILRNLDQTPDDAAELGREMMHDVYRRMIREEDPAQQIGNILLRLSEPQTGPFLVHCSGGKDRTGVVIALLHWALGVDQEDIYHDFMLTQQYYDGRALMHERAAQIIATLGQELDEAALLPIFSVHASYLDAAFDEIKQRSGSADDFLQEIGIGAREREGLARNFVSDA